MAEFSAHLRRDPDRLYLVTAGDFDLAAVDTFTYLAHLVLDGDIRSLVIDLAGVTFIDSAGIGALVTLRNMAAERGTHVVLHRPTPSVIKVLTLTGMTRTFAIEP
jgi:anti-anti-sigma factor